MYNWSMATERTRHLDVGGLNYGKLDGVIFLGLAHLLPQDLFYIVDVTADKIEKGHLPKNVFVSTPQVVKIPIPFLSEYKLKHPNHFFDDARMDMVLDVVQPDVALSMFREVRRCLKPGGVFTVVDEIGNRPETVFLGAVSGMKKTSEMNTRELFKSSYPISQYTEAFSGHDVFSIQFKR
jgi:hypothetical protein